MWVLNLFALLALSTSVTSQPLSDLQSSRIVNGFEISIEKIPYHAALRRRVVNGWAYTCGASIISNRALLTAAHCLVGYDSQPSNLRVVVGTSNRLSGGKTLEISRVIIHEGYNSDNLFHDIAILVTKDTIDYGRGISPISFASPDDNFKDGTEALVSGFGLTEHEGIASSVLLAAKVYIVSQESCAKAYRQIAIVSSGMICANASSPPRDACQGDSGGPLVANGLLVGIVSWGEGCAEPLYPGVYTKVSEYHNWVVKHLEEVDY